jgi:hypothetical protein
MGGDWGAPVFSLPVRPAMPCAGGAAGRVAGSGVHAHTHRFCPPSKPPHATACRTVGRARAVLRGVWPHADPHIPVQATLPNAGRAEPVHPASSTRPCHAGGAAGSVAGGRVRRGARTHAHQACLASMPPHVTVRRRRHCMPGRGPPTGAGRVCVATSRLCKLSHHVPSPCHAGGAAGRVVGGRVRRGARTARGAHRAAVRRAVSSPGVRVHACAHASRPPLVCMQRAAGLWAAARRGVEGACVRQGAPQDRAAVWRRAVTRAGVRVASAGGACMPRCRMASAGGACVPRRRMASAGGACARSDPVTHGR